MKKSIIDLFLDYDILNIDILEESMPKNLNCDLGFCTDIVIKVPNPYEGSGISKGQKRKAYKVEDGFNIITPKHPQGLFMHCDEVFEFKSRGKL